MDSDEPSPSFVSKYTNRVRTGVLRDRLVSSGSLKSQETKEVVSRRLVERLETKKGVLQYWNVR